MSLSSIEKCWSEFLRAFAEQRLELNVDLPRDGRLEEWPGMPDSLKAPLARYKQASAILAGPDGDRTKEAHQNLVNDFERRVWLLFQALYEAALPSTFPLSPLGWSKNRKTQTGQPAYWVEGDLLEPRFNGGELGRVKLGKKGLLPKRINSLLTKAFQELRTIRRLKPVKHRLREVSEFRSFVRKQKEDGHRWDEIAKALYKSGRFSDEVWLKKHGCTTWLDALKPLHKRDFQKFLSRIPK
ncbi:MAG: hypothetical protein L0387_34960 [Acidobacteria bacterium]|nr:hypothetical protein [Acidobacteriota bacterium]